MSISNHFETQESYLNYLVDDANKQVGELLQERYPNIYEELMEFVTGELGGEDEEE